MRSEMRFLDHIKTYLELSKPRVVLLMIFTSFIGMLLAEPINLNYEIILHSFPTTGLGLGAHDV